MAARRRQRPVPIVADLCRADRSRQARELPARPGVHRTCQPNVEDPVLGFRAAGTALLRHVRYDSGQLGSAFQGKNAQGVSLRTLGSRLLSEEMFTAFVGERPPRFVWVRQERNVRSFHCRQGEKPHICSPGGWSSPELATSVLEHGSRGYRPYSFRARQEEPAGKAGRHICVWRLAVKWEDRSADLLLKVRGFWALHAVGRARGLSRCRVCAGRFCSTEFIFVTARKSNTSI